MRKVLLLLLALVMLSAASPAFAQQTDELTGIFSIGLGVGKGEDVDPGPYILSAKYWDPSWELGFEGYLDGDADDDNDALGMLWGIYRISLTDEGDFYVGAGAAVVFENYSPSAADQQVNGAAGFENAFGPIVTVGYDLVDYGFELKYGWFDPGIISLVAYYHLQ